jgi:hypothetical protein
MQYVLNEYAHLSNAEINKLRRYSKIQGIGELRSPWPLLTRWIVDFLLLCILYMVEKALSGKEMQKMLPHASLHLFKDLRKMQTIDSLLGSGDTAIILYELRPGSGHWTTVFKRPNGVIECFDSLGYAPDAEIGFIPKTFQRDSRQDHTHLLQLLSGVANL